MDVKDASSFAEPHGFWCASRLWATGLLAVLIIATCAFVIYFGRAADPRDPTLSRLATPSVHVGGQARPAPIAP